MASASNLQIIDPEDCPASAILQLESVAAEENKMLRLRILEMWDAWSNGREPPSAISGFTELIPRSGEVTNAPVPNPLIPCGHPLMMSNVPSMPSVVRPQMPVSRAPPILFSAAPVCTRAQPTLPWSYVEPPMFTFQGPQLQSEITYVTPYSFIQPPQYDLSGEQEKVVKNSEQEEMDRKIKSLEQSPKNMQGLSARRVSHTLTFLRGVGGKEELLMAYFGESLTGIASEWYIDQEITHWYVCNDMARDFVRRFQYNVDIAPDRNSLSKLKKKTIESFREYAVKWHEQAARVKPPIDESEMAMVFLQAQEANYFQNMMSSMGKPFAEAINIGEMVENSLKTGRILSHVAFKSTSSDVQNGSEGLMNRNGSKEGAMMVSNSKGASRSFS
ncbi:uncharacterized protein [Nicotiana sylvestris]|uniref:uncharacterized protein n=1 Tax=Nicotiana sylvestris TaxID=4096 RepID=UPI00388C5E37